MTQKQGLPSAKKLLLAEAVTPSIRKSICFCGLMECFLSFRFSFLARLYSALLPQTPGRMPERRLASPPHGTLTPARFSRGRPHCVFPHPWGAVTGRKYHCRRQSRREAVRPGLLSSLDGNRSRPLGRSWRIRCAACPLREPCRLRYSDIRICSFQDPMRGFEIIPHL